MAWSCSRLVQLPHLPRREAMAGVAAAFIRPGRARAARRLIRIGQTVTATAPFGKACHAIAAAVAAHPRLSKMFTVDVYDDGEAGDEAALLRGCYNGTIEMALVSTPALSDKVPILGVTDTPFLFKNVAAARAALDGAGGDELAAAARAKGYNILAFAENGLKHMTANKPIRKPSDLVGLKLRVPFSDVEFAGFSSLGALPGRLAFSQLHEALRTGQFEAEENPVGTIEAAHLMDVQKYLSLTGHVYGTAAVFGSQDFLNDLSPDVAAALMVCVRQATPASRQAADEDARAGLARLRAAGMTIVEDVDRDAFIMAARPNLAATREKFGSSVIDRLVQAGS